MPAKRSALGTGVRLERRGPEASEEEEDEEEETEPSVLAAEPDIFLK